MTSDLTHEKLLKFGFKTDGFIYFLKYSNQGEIHIFPPKGDINGFYVMYNGVANIIDSVYRLQSLYYGLSGKRLDE